jgi:hypothetical protein
VVVNVNMHGHQGHGFRNATRMMFNPASYRESGTGSYAAASLILSIVSIFTCGLLSPIPLLLGLVGLIGNKRAKGLAMAGFLLSLMQAGGWIFIFGVGGYQVFYMSKYANQAGSPVVAAIEEYKKDHNGEVPATLEDLVSAGYLPPAWKDGLDGLSGDVRKTVEGKRWSEFLRYQPGEGENWKGGGSGFVAEDEADDWMSSMATEKKASTTYGLAFIGVDGKWGSSDDHEVDQHEGKSFDLSVLGTGGKQMRDLAATKRELEKVRAQLGDRIKAYNDQLPQLRDDLRRYERQFEETCAKKGLATLEEVKGDVLAADQLALIGETVERINSRTQSLAKLRDKDDLIAVKLERLKGAQADAMLAENGEELAKLSALLDETKKALGEKETGLSALDKQNAGEKWFKGRK